KPVVVAVGEQLDLSRWAGQPIDGRVLAEVTDHFMDAITDVLAGLRGETPPAERWDPAAHGQAQTGRLSPSRAAGCGGDDEGMAQRLSGDVAMPRRVAVLGAGSWGTTFAKVLADGGAEVRMWARRPAQAKEINQSGRNAKYLRGIMLPRSIQASADPAAVLEG